MQDRTEFYKKLKAQLDDTGKWPGEYMYKFIVPTIGDGVQHVENVFEEFGAVITTNKSKTGKYTSLTIRVIMPSSDMIIKKYQECEKIEGIVSL